MPLPPRPLAQANEWLENYRKFWEATYQQLDSLLDELNQRPLQAKSNPGDEP